MLASEVMTRDVISVGTDTSVRDVARTLLAHGISAVPVVDAVGTPVGMVSEGDLVLRDEPARLARQDWWLALITGETGSDTDFLATLRSPGRSAKDVMAAPVVTVGEDVELSRIARLLGQHRIKRVPVVKDGRITGIVSRADLLRAFASEKENGTRAASAPHKEDALRTIFEMFLRPHASPAPAVRPDDSKAPGAKTPDLTGGTFRHLVEDFHNGEAHHHDDVRRAAAEQRQRLAETLIDTHVTDEVWQEALHHARKAAEAGETEDLLLRFPNALCTDGGRAINVPEDTWPTTLRGEAAELYLRWERELKGRGFGLSAHVLEFPDGKPGDIGLFLVWGEKM